MMYDQQKRRSKFTSVTVNEVHSNVEQEIIEITSDKLKIILIEHLDSLIKGSSWQTPLSLLITITVVFCTSKFQEFLNVSPDTWKAIFIILELTSSIWLVCSIFKIKERQTIEDFMNKVKNKS